MDAGCGPGSSADACATNMAQIHLKAGDLVGAYRAALPAAEAGDPGSIDLLVEICERAGDTARAQTWRERRAAVGG